MCDYWIDVFFTGASFSHVASVAGYPDLPRWTFLRPYRNDLLLYGSQPSSGSVDIQVSEFTYRLSNSQYQLSEIGYINHTSFTLQCYAVTLRVYR